MRRFALPLLILSLAAGHSALAASRASSEEMLRQRLKDARAVEEVYWKHRLWPESNRGVKPSLESVLPDATLRQRIEDTQRKSAALRILWSRPITVPQLQEELDRMAATTRDPAMLRELFAAIGDHPGRIAESLVRPALADRLARSWYAVDGRFHAAARSRAENEASRLRTIEDMRRAGGEYREIDYLLRSGAETGATGESVGVQALDPEDWERLVNDLADEMAPDDGAALLPAPSALAQNSARRFEALTPGRLGRLREDAEGFILRAIVTKESDRLRVAVVIWRKRAFDAWWSEARLGLPPDPLVTAEIARLPATGGDCANDSWRPLRTEFPYGRQGHSAVWTGSEMIIWGGLSPSGPLRTGYRYQPATDTFTPIRADATAPMARYLHAAVWTGTEMVIWGGDGFRTSPDWINSGGRYDPATDTWRPTRSDATAPTPRIGFAAAWTGTEMFIWGGGGVDGCNCYLGTGGLYDPAHDTWRATSGGAGVPEARANSTAVWTGTEVIVWGGIKQSPCCVNLHSSLDTGARFNPSNNSWTPIAGGGARGSHTAVWTGNVMIVWGGTFFQITGGFPNFSETRVPLNTGSRYDPIGNTWMPTRADATSPSPRSGHTAFWIGSRMLVWGGFFNTGGLYDPVNDTWGPTRADATAPAARSRNTAVWTGTEMIVWGGSGPGGLASTTNSGGRYAPASDTWVPTHSEAILPTGAPQGIAVWTGAEMLFGGLPIGRYDPAIDQWSAMAAPSAGIDPRGPAVWTGAEMITWNGQTGARYNPTTDSWAAVSTASAPASRTLHTSLWTGHEMIVWGGWTATGVALNTGGRYDPAADAWSATRADASTPGPRYFHSAIWTGDRMIIWGGITDAPQTTVLNTGGLYDPTADAWTGTSAQPANPEQRDTHSAVWSGAEMIVWGGLSTLTGTAASNTGWAYSPATDRWRPMAVSPATPPGRFRHAAVWTGREMLVWGGTSNGGTTLQDGGRYDPAADAWSAMLNDATTPSSRMDAASVWTGREMLLSAGCCGRGVGDINTGAGYCACLGPTMTWFRDADGDGAGNNGSALLTCVPPLGYVPTGTDCDDGNAAAWATPGETRDLAFTSATELGWNPPAAPGASSLTYDVLRTGNPADFVAAATCVASSVSASTAVDPEVPDTGGVLYYLARARDACPAGQGDLGSRSDGTPRAGRSCP